MAEAIQNLEKIVLHLAPVIFVAPGIACVVVGICLWLGGLRWIRPTAGLLGVGLGLLAAFFLTDRQSAAFICLAIIGAGFAVFFEKQTLILTGAVTAMMISLLVFAAPALNKTSNWEYLEHQLPDEYIGKDIILDVKESSALLKTELIAICRTIQRCIKTISVKGFVISAIVGLMIMGAGFTMPKFTAAVTCSMLGTAIITIGMMFLLLYKGSKPLSYIYTRASFFAMVAIAMIAFGTVTTLMLCTIGRIHKPIIPTDDGE